MIGLDICGMSTFMTEPILHEIDDITISGAIFDTFRADSEITDSYEISVEWRSTTSIYAEFDGNLYAGNVNLSVKNTDNIIIKRRRVGEFTWFPMFHIRVVNSNSFNFSLTDRYASSGMTYQYAVVPVINGADGEYSLGKNELTDEEFIECKFDGIVLLDRDSEYMSVLDIQVDFQKNQSKNYVVPLNSKRPFVISNSMNNYYSGTVSGTFLRMDGCNFYPDLESMEYREDFLNFLVNDNFKILKLYDGRTYMVEVVDTPTDTNTEHWQKHTISFNFIEVGDVLSNRDMYLNGFLDITEEWWNT